jgi:hypothetical protein
MNNALGNRYFDESSCTGLEIRITMDSITEKYLVNGKVNAVRSELWTARNAVSLRETGLRKMAERHARERMQKEQELQAARAEVELLERVAEHEPQRADGYRIVDLETGDVLKVVPWSASTEDCE